MKDLQFQKIIYSGYSPDISVASQLLLSALRNFLNINWFETKCVSFLNSLNETDMLSNTIDFNQSDFFIMCYYSAIKYTYNIDVFLKFELDDVLLSCKKI